MAMGIPVIASDWGGPSDYLDGRCGILVKPINRQIFREGLADAMLKLARNPSLRRRLGRAGRNKVIREFDWEKKVDAMVEIYRRAVFEAATRC
jgi:glycosyltransferase involved in cell wall biosynthesis